MNRQVTRLAKILRDINDYNELEAELNPRCPVRVFPWIIRDDAGALSVRKSTDKADLVQRPGPPIRALTGIQGAKSSLDRAELKMLQELAHHFAGGGTYNEITRRGW